MLKFGSLFSGIGGFDLGFDRAGMECAWQVEIDADCSKVLEVRYPSVKRIKDVRKAGRHNLEPVDVICFGWPCQDFSVAGLRAGISGGRSGLFWEAARIIREIRPRILVAENVPGLLSSWSRTEPPPFEIPTRDFHSEEEAQRWADSFQGDWDVEETSDFETILIALGELGYGFSQRVLDAQYDNVAQRRERVFIVGSLGNGCGLSEAESSGKLDSLHFQILFDEVSLSWDSAPRRETGSNPSAAITTGAGKGSGPRNGNGQPMHLIPEVAWALQERDSLSAEGGAGGQVAVAFTLHGSDKTVSTATETDIAGSVRTKAPGSIENSSTTAVAFGWNKSDSQTMRVDEETTDAIQSAPSSQPAVAFHENKSGQLHEAEVLGLRANASHSYRGIGGEFGVRRLTPTECMRLQAFPDWWFDDANGNKILSDSAMYRCLGNAVCANVAYWIGKRIVELT